MGKTGAEPDGMTMTCSPLSRVKLSALGAIRKSAGSGAGAACSGEAEVWAKAGAAARAAETASAEAKAAADRAREKRIAVMQPW